MSLTGRSTRCTRTCRPRFWPCPSSAVRHAIGAATRRHPERPPPREHEGAALQRGGWRTESGLRLRHKAQGDPARGRRQVGRERETILPRTDPEGRPPFRHPSCPAEKGKEMSMAVNVDRKIGRLGPVQRKKVEARSAELIEEEMTLRELRTARQLTQVRMARTLGITQDSVSRLERRSDLLLSTLRKAVEAMGGNLSLVAEFPDRAPVVLSGIAEDDPQPNPTARRHARG